MTRMMLSVLGMGAALAMGGIGGAHAQTAPTMAKNNYADKAAWLCWTGKPGDACAIDLSTTVVKADGTMCR